jgi:hypothetical protein
MVADNSYALTVEAEDKGDTKATVPNNAIGLARPS